jgi:hypothetical protein
MIFGLIINIALCILIPEFLGEKRKIGYKWSMLACIFLTPIIGLIVTLASPKLKKFKSETIIEKKREKEEIIGQENNRIMLKELKDQHILTDSEYQEKINKIDDECFDSILKKTREYENLSCLFSEGILTGNEFKAKCDVLKKGIKHQQEKKTEIIKEYSEGLTVCYGENGLYGFLDKNQKVIIDFNYEFAENFSDGLSLVRLNRMFGFINKENNKVIPLIFDNAFTFKNGKALVEKDKREYYIDLKGEEIEVQKI